MSSGDFRAGDYGVIFDGQSLNVYPTPDAAGTYPRLTMAGRLAPFGVPAVGGLSWAQLDNDLPSRVGPFLKMSPVIVYVMVGGTTQINFGGTAAGIYASMGSIRDDVEALLPGASTFLAIGCTTTPSTTFSAGEELVRLELNEDYVLADPSGYFDAVVDFDSDACLATVPGACYADGTHPSLTGRAAMAALVGPAIDSLI